MGKVLENATANTSPSFHWVGGRGLISAYGALGGGTLSVLYRTDEDDAFRPATGASPTATLQGVAAVPLEEVFEMPACEMQLVLAGASGANLTVEVNPIQQAY